MAEIGNIPSVSPAWSKRPGEKVANKLPVGHEHRDKKRQDEQRKREEKNSDKAHFYGYA